MRPVLVSACLLGLKVRYDGRGKEREDFLPEDVVAVPVCPEVLGGLPTPRPPAELEGGSGDDVIEGRAKVVNSQGTDVTEEFVRGAEAAVKIAGISGAKEAYLKSESPSCDVKFGVAAALLMRRGIRLHKVE